MAYQLEEVDTSGGTEPIARRDPINNCSFEEQHHQNLQFQVNQNVHGDDAGRKILLEDRLLGGGGLVGVERVSERDSRILGRSLKMIRNKLVVQLHRLYDTPQVFTLICKYLYS